MDIEAVYLTPGTDAYDLTQLLKKQQSVNYGTGTPGYSCNCVHVAACFVIMLVFVVQVSVYLSVYVQDLRHSRAVKKIH